MIPLNRFTRAIVVSLMATCWTGVAWGQGANGAMDAKDLYQAGKQAYAEGRYEESIAKFEQAFELSGKALLLYNLSLAYERVGNYKGALESLRGYLAAAPPEEVELVKKRIQNLKKRVEAQAKDEQNQLEKERLELDLERQRLEQARSEQERLEQERHDREAAALEKAAQLSPGPAGPSKLPAYFTLGAGGVALAAAGVLGGLAVAARGEAGALCADNGICRTEAREPMKRDQNLAIGADVSMGVGLAVVATGLFLLFWDFEGEPAKPAATPAATRLSFATLAGGGAFGLGGCF